jgi:hypothetical protein
LRIANKKYPVNTGYFLLVVLKSKIYQNFDGIIGEIGKWAEILG